jgi:hypothetical protein
MTRADLTAEINHVIDSWILDHIGQIECLRDIGKLLIKFYKANQGDRLKVQ